MLAWPPTACPGAAVEDRATQQIEEDAGDEYRRGGAGARSPTPPQTQFQDEIYTGGLVAIKEADGLASYYYPADPPLLSRLLDALGHAGNVQARGVVRAAALRRWLERAGLVEVRQQSFPEDTWAPMSPVEREGTVGMLRYFAAIAESLDLPETDHAFWRTQADPAHPDALINHPDFYHRISYILAVGRVPIGA